MFTVLLDLEFIPSARQSLIQREGMSSKKGSIPSSIGQKGNNTVYNILYSLSHNIVLEDKPNISETFKEPDNEEPSKGIKILTTSL